MQTHLSKGLFLCLFLVFSWQSKAQTTLNITDFTTTDLDGTASLGICPGRSYQLDFTVTSGQINGSSPTNPATINVIIEDAVLGVANPISGSTIGSFSNPSVLAITSTSGTQTVTVNIPLSISNGQYDFSLVAEALDVTPSPSSSNTVQRQLNQNPSTFIVLDTADARYSNVFFTDTASRLLSKDVVTGVPIVGGTAPIPSVSMPTPNNLFLDSTINFCSEDSLYVWNSDSLSAQAHIWMVDGSPVPNLPTNQGHLWISNSGYYSLVVTSLSICSDSSAAISFGDPNKIADSISIKSRAIYFNSYSVDDTLKFIGPGNLSGPGGTLGEPNRFCAGDSVLIYARGNSSHPLGGYGYVWVKDNIDTLSIPQPGDSAITVKEAGDYKVYITEFYTQGSDTIFMCSAESTPVTVTVDALPIPTIAPSATQTYCYGDTVRVFDTLLPYNADNLYEWVLNGQTMTDPRFTDTNFISVDTTTLKSFGIEADTTAYFQLRITDILGCDSLSAPTLVNFTLYPVIRLTPNRNTFQLCPGDTLEVLGTVANSVAIGSRVQWFDVTTGNLIVNSALLRTGDEGSFFVEAETAGGCIKRDTITVTYYTVSANAGPDVSVLSGERVELSGTGGINYQWRAELGKPISANTFFDQTISVSYTLPDSLDADTVKMYLLVTDNNGCSDIDSLNLFISREAPNPVTITGLDRAYNLFTPNDDGTNDVWNITSVYKEGDICEIRIINRWGATVYDQENFNGLWDGDDNGGNPLPDGTYYYILSCNNTVRVKSAVTLMRNEN